MNLDRAAKPLAVLGAVLTPLVLAWLAVGVGIIGRDGDPANRMYFGVIAVLIVGALVARFRAGSMPFALWAAALAQAAVGAWAIFGGLGRPYSGALELTLLNGFFVVAFVVTGWLFRESARRGGTL